MDEYCMTSFRMVLDPKNKLHGRGFGGGGAAMWNIRSKKQLEMLSPIDRKHFEISTKIKEAMDRLVPIVIETAIAVADDALAPIISMPLHKGEKGFMSPKQFEEFYWPSFKQVLLGIIEEGLIPFPFAEGNYIPRLEIIQDMPHASMAWYFEYMDMKRAKETVGKNNCIVGNLPITIMVTRTPEDVKKGCRQLIEDCAPGGGYILGASASMDQGHIDNLHAMFDTAKEYGIY